MRELAATIRDAWTDRHQTPWGWMIPLALIVAGLYT